MQTLSAATKYDSRVLSVTLRASRNAGMLAELMTKALRTCALNSAEGTSVSWKNGASRSG